MEKEGAMNVIELGCAVAETRGPFGPIEEFVLSGPIPALDND
jgi:hypothetical protein